jgi:hypothetical protein
VPDRPGDPSDEPTAAESGGFLPPQPPGPEPDLGTPAAPEPPPPPAAWPPPNAGFPAGAAGGQPQPPPPGQPWQPPPPPGWQPPPQQQQQWPPPPPVWHPPAPPVPGNSQAVAGFVLSVVAAGLLVVSFGTSSIISLACAVLGIVFSRKGRRNVEEGRTPKHGDLARAGFITGIVALVLTLLATAAWIAVIAAAATDGSA